jgi:hypothetical protein
MTDFEVQEVELEDYALLQVRVLIQTTIEQDNWLIGI